MKNNEPNKIRSITLPFGQTALDAQTVPSSSITVSKLDKNAKPIPKKETGVAWTEIFDGEAPDEAFQFSK